jgi:peptidylprolyl isomerase
MQRDFLIIGAILALVVAGCGGGSASTDTSSAVASPFRIPNENPSIRYEAEIKADAKRNALVGFEPKPIIPNSPPPEFIALTDLIEGIGHLSHVGEKATVQYVGFDYSSGKKFDSSWDRGEPFTFTLGAGEVIKGWDEGLVGMEVGDRRELVIPPELGYGSRRVGKIRPNSTLVFVVDLLAVEKQ